MDTNQFMQKTGQGLDTILQCASIPYLFGRKAYDSSSHNEPVARALKAGSAAAFGLAAQLTIAGVFDTVRDHVNTPYGERLLPISETMTQQRMIEYSASSLPSMYRFLFEFNKRDRSLILIL